MKKFLLFICLLFSSHAFGATGYQTFKSLPQDNTNFPVDTRTMFRDEDSERFKRSMSGFVFSGVPATTSGTLSHTIIATDALASDGHVCVQTSITASYTPNRRTFVYCDPTTDTIHSISGGSGCTLKDRIGSGGIPSGAHLIRVECSTNSAEPDKPIDTVPLMAVDTNGSTITAIIDLRAIRPVVSGRTINEFKSISDAVIQIGSVVDTLTINRNILIGVNTVIPSNITSIVASNGHITLLDTAVLTVSSFVAFPHQKVFTFPTTNIMAGTYIPVIFASDSTTVAMAPWWGTKSDGTDATSTRFALQAMFDSGAKRQHVPKASVYYATDGPLWPQSETEISGDGVQSFIYNTSTVASGTVMRVIFAVGGYAGSAERSFYNETFYALGNEFQGAESVTLNTVGEAANFSPGDMVVIRGAEADSFVTEFKPIPMTHDLNEVEAVNVSTGTVTLRHPLTDDMRTGTIAKSSGTLGTLVNGLERKATIKKRLVIRNMKLRNNRIAGSTLSGAAFGWGGCFECTFRDLDMDVDHGFYMNLISHVVYENSNVRFKGVFSECSYLSQNVAYRNIVASFTGDFFDGGLNRFFLGLNEACKDIVIDNVYVNMGTNRAPSVLTIVSSRNVTIRNSMFIAPYLNGTDIIRISSSTSTDGQVEVAPRNILFENNTIYVTSNTDDVTLNSLGAISAIRVDTGGLWGGHVAIKNNAILGYAKVAAILISEIGIRDVSNDQNPTTDVIVTGNRCVRGEYRVGSSQTVTQGKIPETCYIGIYNHKAPVDTTQTVINASMSLRRFLIRDNDMITKQLIIEQGNVGTFQSISTQTAFVYNIAARSVTTNASWLFCAVGRVTGTANVKTITFRFNTIIYHTLTFAAGDTGDWRICTRLYGTSAHGRDIENNDLVTSAQVLQTVSFINGVETRDRETNTVNFYSQNSAPDWDIRVAVVNASDAIIVDHVSVVPSGHEWGYVNWELLKAVFGGYPTIVN